MHNLTELGRQAAEEAETNVPAFCDRLASAVYDSHPYFRAFIDILRIMPIGCPEVSEGEVEQARRAGLGTSHWVELVTERIPHQTTTTCDTERIRNAIVSVVRHRFGKTPERNPTSKQLAAALNDAYIEAAITIRGLPIGATDLKIMKTWGSQLMLIDQSRYVPTFPGQNVIWLAADVKENGGIVLTRKTLESHESPLADAVIAAYRDQARAAKTSLKAPYLPIFCVRAQAAFDCRVTRALVDLVIERLAKGSISEPNVQVWLHLGTTRQPDSEPVYRRGGNRRYEITVQPRSEGDQHAC